MKLTEKQLLEIDFLEKSYLNSLNSNSYEVCKARREGKEIPPIVKTETTKEQKEEYVRWSVYGEGKKLDVSPGQDKVVNPLILAKRSLDIDVKAWRQDLTDGLFLVDEFIEDFNHPFATKLFRGILRGIDFSKAKVGRGTPEFVLLNNIRKIEG